MVIINGKDVSKFLIGCREVGSGDCVWIPDSDDTITPENEMFLEEIRESAQGRTFLAKFKFGPNFDTIMATVDLLHPYAPYVTTSLFLDAVKVLMTGAPDKLLPREEVPVATPAAPPPATDKNGRVLSDSQKAWSEYRNFSETHSMKDVRDRMRIDPGYASFVNTNRQREFQGVGDSYVPTNPHLLPKQELSDEAIRGAAAKASLLLPQLKAWVAEYTTTPSSRVRFLRSTANPFYEQYEKSFQAAISAGLI